MTPSVPAARSWAFIAAAAIPGAALLLFCGIGIHEWWLIRSGQLVVAPPPVRGMTSLHGLPAAALLPWILGSGLMGGSFAYALLRGSRKALAAAYLLLALVVGAGVALRPG